MYTCIYISRSVTIICIMLHEIDRFRLNVHVKLTLRWTDVNQIKFSQLLVWNQY
jgi:hypothetical protein